MPRTHTFLLVEDDDNDAELALRAFKKASATNKVVRTRTGQEALDFLFVTGEYSGRDIKLQPDAVLLDVNLPKLDGFEVLKRIRADERTATLPVVMLSSSLEERDITRSYRLGANSFVRKPIDFIEFCTAVQQLSSYWLGLNQPAKI